MEAWKEKRDAYNAGKLSRVEARNFIKQDRQSFIEREFKNSEVTYLDALEVYKLATPEEQPLLRRLLAIKRVNQIRNYGANAVRKAEAEAAKQ
jgi:hypothetical protein